VKEWDYAIETLITAKPSLVIFWLKESDNLQLTGSMFNVQSSMLRGEEIVDDLEAALEQFRHSPRC
jgi:hypothetical protein